MCTTCSSFDSFFLVKLKTLTSLIIFRKVSCIRLFLQLIKALDVARKCLPKMIGMLFIPLVDYSILSTKSCHDSKMCLLVLIRLPLNLLVS